MGIFESYSLYRAKFPSTDGSNDWISESNRNESDERGLNLPTGHIVSSHFDKLRLSLFIRS